MSKSLASTWPKEIESFPSGNSCIWKYYILTPKSHSILSVSIYYSTHQGLFITSTTILKRCNTFYSTVSDQNEKKNGQRCKTPRKCITPKRYMLQLHQRWTHREHCFLEYFLLLLSLITKLLSQWKHSMANFSLHCWCIKMEHL